MNRREAFTHAQWLLEAIFDGNEKEAIKYYKWLGDDLK